MSKSKDDDDFRKCDLCGKMKPDVQLVPSPALWDHERLLWLCEKCHRRDCECGE